MKRHVIFILILLLSCGCGSAESGSGTNADTQVSERSASQDPISTISARLSSHDIVAVEFGAAPEVFKGLEGPWLYVTVTNIEGPQAIRAKLDGYLLVGAYLRDAAEAGAESITGFSILSSDMPGCAPSPTSITCEAPGTSASGLADYDESKWQTTDGDLRNAISTRIAAAGLEEVSLTFETPVESLVPILVVRTANPEAFVRGYGNGTVAVLGDSTKYEGFFQVVDQSDQPVVVSAFASRLSRGTGWTRPDLIKYFD